MNYRVKNWTRYQHYKDRNPPWIKLHWELLSSMDWVTLDDASRVLAVAIMLVASRNGGEIRGDEEGLRYLERVAHLNKKPNLNPLINCGLLVPASEMLAECLQSARPETEEEVLTETPLAPSVKKRRPGKVSWSEGGGFAIPAEQREAWGIAFPAVNIDAQVAKAHAWAIANPKNRKGNWARFLHNWLQRSQDSAKPEPKGGNQFAGVL